MRFINVLFEFFAPECPVRQGSDGHDSELPPEKRQVGGKYYNRQRMTRYLGIQVLNDGKRVGKCLEELLNERLVWQSKKGSTVSLNPHLSAEITSFIEKFLKADS